MLIKHDESPICCEYIYNGRTLSVTRSLLRHVRSRPPWLRATLITSLALLGGALLVSVLTVMITSLKTYTLTPADLLPAKETLILFSSADDALLRQYEPWLPIIKNLPAAEIPRTVAIVQVPDEGKVLVIFARRPVVADALPSGSRWTTHEVGPLLVAASSPAIFSLLDAPTQPLHSSESFTLLSRGVTDQQPWIFVQRALLPTPETLMDAVLDTILLQKVTHLGIFPRSGSSERLSKTGSGMIVRLFPASDIARSLPLPPPEETSSLSLALSNPKQTFLDVQKQLSQTNHVLLMTRVPTFLSTIFGDDLSFEYDVLPLLSRPARLSIASTASGTSSLLLQGSASDAAARIAQLHEAFRGSRTTARTITRTFDGRYTFRNIRDDTQALTDEYVPVGGMQMHKTVHTRQGAFCSALQGENFILSTDCALLERMVLGLPQGPGTSGVAAGTFSRPALFTLLSNALPSLLGPTSPLLPSKTDTLQWSLSRQGDILTLTLFP